MTVMYKLPSGVVLVFVSLINMKRLRRLVKSCVIQFLTEMIFVTEF